MKHVPINFSPFATNVLDVVNVDYLCTPSGTHVFVGRNGIDFVVYVGGEIHLEKGDNLATSYFLNQRDVGRMVRD